MRNARSNFPLYLAARVLSGGGKPGLFPQKKENVSPQNRKEFISADTVKM